MRCNQCVALMINGYYCHETGCPNTHKIYNKDRKEWIEFIDCYICGFPIEIGEICSCQEET